MFCYVPATSAAHNRLLFFSFLLQPFTVLMKQTRQAIHAVKQSIFLDVYAQHSGSIVVVVYAECYFQTKVLKLSVEAPYNQHNLLKEIVK